MEFPVINKPTWSPPRLMIYTPPGLGKSTLGASIPNSIMLQTEDGSDKFTNDRLPVPADFDEFMAELEYCKQLEHKIVIIDTMSAVAKLAEDKLLKESGKASLKAMGWGATDKLERLCNDARDKMDELRKAGKAIIIMAHATHRIIDDPQLPDTYNRWDILLPKKVAASFTFWCDQVMVGLNKVTVAKDENNTKKQPIGSGVKLHCGPRDNPAFFTKNRFNFPETIDFSWAAIASEIKNHKARIQGETK